MNHLSPYLVATFLLTTLLLSNGCRKPESAPSSESTTETKNSQATGRQNEVLGSLPDFQFTDQSGATVRSEDLQGKVSVVNFIFTACPSTCPRQTEMMRRLNEKLDQEATRVDIELISITVDPENDTTEVLADYALQNGATPQKWKFLRGGKDEIWEFSKEGLKLPVAVNKNDPLIPIAHDSKFVLIDRLGQIRGYFNVLEANGIDELWEAIGHVLPEFTPAPSVWPQFAGDDHTTHIAQPPEILNSQWLDAASQQEASILSTVNVETGFQFTHARNESGITFNPQIVDDQRFRLLVNHYDHGNSVSVSDVDGDGLLDFYFVSQVGPNELWRNLGDGKFENITTKAGVGLADRISVAGAFADADNDGDVDLFVTTIRNGNALFENDGSGKFTDITEQAGLAYSGHSSTGTFFDYNNDGLLDLFVTNVGKFTTEEYVEVRKDRCNSQPETTIKYYVGRPDAFGGHLNDELAEKSLLYQNLGNNSFKDVSSEVGLNDNSWSGDAIPIDANSDGWLDLYVLNMQGDDHLYINMQGEKFQEQTAKHFDKTPWGAMGVTQFDFNQDGQFELTVTDMHSDMSEDIRPDREKLKSRMQWPADFLVSGRGIYGNAFFSPSENGKYQEQSDQIGAENYWPWGLSHGDLNADGYDDLFIASSMCFPYRYGMNSVLLNVQGEKFVDAQFALNVEPRPAGTMLAPWFALDASGVDQKNRLCKNRSGEVVVWSAQGSRSSALVDFDQDGDLDILTNEFNTPPLVLKSNLTDQSENHWVKIELQGTTSNRDGLGARVAVKTSQGTRYQVNDGKSGYLAQSRMPLYFGLGRAKEIDELEVRWPSGKVQKIAGPLPVNRQHKVSEPAN